MSLVSLTKKTLRFVFSPVTKLLVVLLGSTAGARRRRRAQRIATTMLHEFSRLGFTRKVGTKKRVKRQKVRFEEPLLLTRDELWCPISLQHLPTGVRPLDLQAEDVIDSLEERVNSGVRVDHLPNGKLCFVVRVRGATFPERFPISAVEIPPDAPPLAFPLGMGGDGDQGWVDLRALPHLLIVGPTNKGKSTLIHTILTTWISRNGPEDVELWLCDHKGGVELNRYKELMATSKRPGIVRRFSYKPSETISLLQTALKELERRLGILRANDCSDINDLAKHTGQHLRPIAIVIDEIFFLMLNKEKIDPEVGKSSKKGGFTIRDWAEQLFAKIASAGRAPGIHLIIATQKSGKDVLTSLITANFETRVAFGMASMYESIYILGNSAAVGLPRGRIILRREGGDADEYQTPWISPDQTRLLISRIARFGPDGGLGRDDEAARFRDDAKLLIQVACEYFEGAFAIQKLFGHEEIKGAVNRARIEEIAQRLERDGVLSPGGPRKPRRVARAFFNRPELLDSMYGPDVSGMPDTSNLLDNDPEQGEQGGDESDGVILILPAEDTSLAHTAAEKPHIIDHDDTSLILPAEPGMIPAPDTDIAMPDLFRRTVDQIEETDAKPKRKRKPKPGE